VSLRRRGGLFLALAPAAALWLLLFAAAPVVVHAQDAPPLVPADQSQEHSPGPTLDLGDLARQVGAQVWAGFDLWLGESGAAKALRFGLKLLGLLGQKLLGGLTGAEARVDVLTRLDADATLGDPTVRAVWSNARLAFDALVGAGVVVAGFAVLVRLGGVNAAEVGQLLPRALLGTVLVNASLEGLRYLVDASNALGAFLVGGGARDFGRTALEQLPPEEAGGLLLLVGVMALLLFVQRFVMHAVLAVLAMSAPLALAAWVIPMWAQWFWRWFSVLLGLLVAAAFQVMLLAAGSGMLARFLAHTDDLDARRMVAGGVAVGVLGLACAPGLVGFGLAGGTTLAMVRRGVALAANWQMAAKTHPALAAASAAGPTPGAAAPVGGSGPVVGPAAGVGAGTGSPWPGAGGAGAVVAAAWGHGGGGQPTVVVYQPIGSLPSRGPTSPSSGRPALPPPDYLRR
jgi:hypothetical protein